jgi:uncharacterized protein YjeT (DUF2065 family)
MLLFNLIPFIFIILGLLNIIYPKASWYMRYGWQFKNAEPSDAALVMSRIGGVFAILIGLFILFSGILRIGGSFGF